MRHKHPSITSSQFHIPYHSSSNHNITKAQISQQHWHRCTTTNGPEAMTTLLTLPKATIATPLPKPETATGVLRWIVLPSPI
jgi:hypothetical protein